MSVKVKRATVVQLPPQDLLVQSNQNGNGLTHSALLNNHMPFVSHAFATALSNAGILIPFAAEI
jgi:hypothetical protein